MGMFSFFTQDTDERIVNGKPMHVVMVDNKGNQYVEECYEGYGVFGGKDYYELLAEMNGHEVVKLLHGMGYAVEDKDGKNHHFDSEEQAKDKLRSIGIELAFDGHPHGDNPNVLHPSLTANGEYFNGEPPAADPDQGFTDEEIWGDYYDFNEEED